jgi:MoaA/NifB/PqqE/SkfB family radical SAM enzyme
MSHTEKKEFIFNIDTLGACNLRCPSCPQGNVETRNPQGFMAPELLEKIINKAKSECKVVNFELFNWTEPLLHPKMPEMVKMVQSHDIKCDLSSNLNKLPDADKIMAANPFRFRISCSGFTQEVYGRTHRAGNIEVVKENMVKLAEAKKRTGATTLIHLFYHRYKHNLREEPLMREFSEKLGFQFLACWAAMMPVEKVADYAEGKLAPEDKEVVDLLLLPLDKALTVGRGEAPDKPCLIQTEKIALDFKGNVVLCCGIYDSTRFKIGNYLDMPIEKIQELRMAHSMCGRCARHGVFPYITTGGKAFDDLALANVPSADDMKVLRKELDRNKVRKMLESVSRKIFTMEQSAYLGSKFDRVRQLLGK